MNRFPRRTAKTRIASILVGAVVIGLIPWLVTFAEVPDDELIGVVASVEGEAAAMQDARFRRLAVQSAVFRRDILSTGLGGRLKLTLLDETEFTLAQRSNLVVEEYMMNPKHPKAKFRLLSGSIRVVTGKIAHMNKNAFTLKTPVASAGVRGTEFLSYEVGGSRKFLLLSGNAVVIENASGRVELTTPCHVAEVIDARSAPIRLGRIESAEVDQAIRMTFMTADLPAGRGHEIASREQDSRSADEQPLEFRRRTPDEGAAEGSSGTRGRAERNYCR